MGIQVRKIVKLLEETRMENGQPVPGPHRVAFVGAVIANPYPSEYVQDLVTLADALGEEIGRLIGPPCVELLGGEVEAFGKAALVGIDGEVEHGSALIHNLRFGNVFRNAAGGTELLPAAEKTGLPGSPIDIPLKHKLDAKTRSHHQTVTFQVADAPRPREILVACVAANAGRPLARLAVFGAETKNN
ncbi:amino acid synthesis family protein [Rhizohabitans arisaemae]|uniref:amino acid synthesis family protein n=1 Tax=Rhizohabitans arisaemae TaxID=2720610 RepID=UPI0024B0A5CC|nr:amino acid synthesis family protein [Rhizohabitans arisaemae]